MNDDRAMEDLRKAMEEMVVKRYKSTEGACSGSLSPSKVAQIMGASTASLEKVKGDGVLRGFAPQRYFITVKNIDNGEECVHGQVVQGLSGWHKLFLDQPIFRNLNLVQEPRFPNLREPSGTTELWTHTFVKKSGANFLVIATLAFDWIPELEGLPNISPDLKTDTVIVHAQSPMLPQTYSLYNSMKSSRSRKMCSLHYAFAELAKSYGFEVKETSTNVGKQNNDWSTSIFHSEAAVDNSSWSHFTLTGAFPSNAVEYSAGSVTIPLTLQKLRFLLFSLDDQALMHYAMVQPHKYGYAFQIPNLSWWRVMATVNMYGEWLGIEKTFQDKNLSLLEPIRIPSAQGIGSQGALFDMVDTKMLEDTFKKIEKSMDNVYAEFGKCLNLEAPDVRSLFQNHSGHVDITSGSLSTQTLEKLHPVTWRWLLKFLGLDLMKNTLVQKISWATHKRDVSKGNAFLASLIDSYTNPGALSKIMPARGFLVDNIEIWFTLCDTLAKAVFNRIRGGTPTQSSLRHEIVSGRKDLTPVPMTFEKLISLCRDLMDSNPESWVEKFYPALETLPIPFILSIIDYHSSYAVFFPEKRWGDPAKVWDMVQHAFVYNHRIAKARHHAQTVARDYNIHHDKDVLASAFSYLLFTFDKNRDLDYWGMNPDKNPKNDPDGRKDQSGDTAALIASSTASISETLHTIREVMQGSDAFGNAGGARHKPTESGAESAADPAAATEAAAAAAEAAEAAEAAKAAAKAAEAAKKSGGGKEDDGNVSDDYVEEEGDGSGVVAIMEAAVNEKKDVIRTLKAQLADNVDLDTYTAIAQHTDLLNALGELKKAFKDHPKRKQWIDEKFTGLNLDSKTLNAAMDFLRRTRRRGGHAHGGDADNRGSQKKSDKPDNTTKEPVTDKHKVDLLGSRDGIEVGYDMSDLEQGNPIASNFKVTEDVTESISELIRLKSKSPGVDFSRYRSLSPELKAAVDKLAEAYSGHEGHMLHIKEKFTASTDEEKARQAAMKVLQDYPKPTGDGGGGSS